MRLIPLFAAILLLAGPGTAPARAQDAVILFDAPPSSDLLLDIVRATREGGDARPILNALDESVATVYTPSPPPAPPPVIAEQQAHATTAATPSAAPAPLPIVPAAAPALQPPQRIDFATQIAFGIASPDIAPGQVSNIRPYGELLAKDPDIRLRVSGHAAGDPAGASAGHQYLSRLRAEAVRNLIIREFGIGPARIEAYGAGTAEPIPGTAHPAAAENRRVQFSVL